MDRNRNKNSQLNKMTGSGWDLILEKLLRRQRRRRVFSVFVSLACVVTMVTTYAMILPAITAVIEDMVGTEIAVTEEEELAEEIVEEEEEEILSEETLPEESLPEDTVLQENAGGVTVTAEFAQNVLPEDVSMMVEEVDASDYADMVASAVGDGYTIRKVLDITFLSEGVETEPDGEVRVTFQDPAICAMTDPDVVHISGDGSTEVMETMVTDDEIVFDATGFSAYAIVEGPQPVPVGWSKITSMQELFDKGSTTGLKIGNPEGFYFKNTLTKDSKRTGITKTKPAEANPGDGAATYYFERVEGSDNQIYAYCYAADGTTKQYVYNGLDNSLSFTDEANKTAFTVTQNGDIFTFNNGAWYWNMQGGTSGSRFCCYNNSSDVNNNMNLWYEDELESDPYNLNGKTYGLMNWNGGVAGKALMSTVSSTGNKLDAKSMTVMSTADGSDTLFAPSDSEISMWTFHWISGDKYYLTSEVGGSTQYLKIDASGLSMVDSQEQASQVRVVPGTGNNAGEICLKSGGTTLTYTGSVAEGYSVNGSTGSEWLKLVELSELTKDYFMTYSARKVSVSDESVTNGTPVIVYTRSWNEERLKYDYYAISSDGSLVPVYECGDSIEWVSGQLNKLLWDFTEYYWEGTTDPNFYYDLYNQYSGKYIDPQVAENEVLSDEPIGINLNGRRDGKYYSTILAWDDEDYAFVGLKVENGKVVPCPKSEAMDFYFAEMQDLNVDDKMTTVETVDNNEFGIKMKMKNFPDRTTMSDFLGNNDGTANHNLHQGLLSMQLGANGYPTATKTGFSLEDMYNLNGEAPQDVNHLFIQSTYEETGYFEYDSAQNFATLKKTNDGNFTVYNELGTYDSGGDKPTLKHGQFFPYNDLKPGTFASKNGQNLYDVHSNELPDSDPRKHEHLYSIEYDNVKADCYFGMELEASFTETHNGKDAWGHDIIFEFTGDDDFWMYVDGELIIDLGGIHSAVPGSVNFSTGAVNVNGEKTTLRALFAKNYKARNPDATDEEVADFLANYFEGDSRIFKENTTHTMKIFYMERGAGASNLHMRFNLASVKEGEVLLSKTLAGVDESGVLAEFPYQIFYKKGSDEEYRLQNGVVGADGQPVNYVLDQDSSHPVTYRPSVTIDGTLYQDVFFLKPDEVAEISFPEGMTTYRIVECGVDTQVYNKVSVNKQTLNGTDVGTSGHRKDYGIDYDTTDGRPKVNYVNQVDPEALRTLTITKKLYKEDGTTEIPPGQDQTEFSFRLFMATEYDDLELANMHPYHVKDPDGYYCSWNIAEQQFVKIEPGITDFSALTKDQKEAATFTTSIYGSISKIRAGYTVEVRDVLAGTKYRVEERPGEIPDGYTLKDYYRYNQHADRVKNASGVWGVEGQVVPGENAPMEVHNLKGYGLRMNKVWTDAGFMSDRDPTYYALFTKNASEELVLVPGSVRQLAYDAKPQTVYWYYDRLPVAGTTGLNDYYIREVKISEGNPTVSPDGTVSDYGTVTPLENNSEVSLQGKAKGEEAEDYSNFTYTVKYDQGEISSGSNVRVDTVTNDRPGIILKKQNQKGDALKGAVFTLKTPAGTDLGTYTSDEDGFITTAYLSEDKEYTLTETKSPKGYQALPTSMTISLHNGTVTVRGVSEADYQLISKIPGDFHIATLIIKNKPYHFRVVKIDGDTEAPLAGATFDIHCQKTVGDVTTFDLDPMPGYESLITDVDGLITKGEGNLHEINDLPAGTYQLREITPPSGYEKLPSYVVFEISNTGVISLKSGPEGVSLESTTGDNGETIYTLKIENHCYSKLKVLKIDQNGDALEGAEFEFVGKDFHGSTGHGTMTSKKETQDSTEAVIIQDGEVPLGTYTLHENSAPANYSTLAGNVVIQVSMGEGSGEPVVSATVNGTAIPAQYVTKDQGTGVWTIKIMNTQGYELPSTGGPGEEGLLLAGGMMVIGAAVLLIRRFTARIR